MNKKCSICKKQISQKDKDAQGKIIINYKHFKEKGHDDIWDEKYLCLKCIERIYNMIKN